MWTLNGQSMIHTTEKGSVGRSNYIAAPLQPATLPPCPPAHPAEMAYGNDVTRRSTTQAFRGNATPEVTLLHTRIHSLQWGSLISAGINNRHVHLAKSLSPKRRPTPLKPAAQTPAESHSLQTDTLVIIGN